MEHLERAPIFKLYGGHDDWPGVESIHCETIATRSHLYNWHIQPHRHSGLYQILHLHRGHAVVSLDDIHHPVDGPAVVEIPQAFVHGFQFDEDCAGHVVTLAYPALRRVMQRLDPEAALPAHPVIHRLLPDQSDPDLDQACTQINALYRSSDPFREAQIEAWLTLLYARIRSQNRSRKQPPRQARSLTQYSRFSQLLESEFSSHHDVSWYAKRLGLSATHLNIVTRTHADKTPLQIIHERLTLEARRSLAYTSIPISQISENLGFLEPAHFTRFFRRVTAESPRQFRQRIASIEPLTGHQSQAGA